MFEVIAMKMLCYSFLFALILAGGCTTKSNARAEARAAYNAGRAAAFQQMLEEEHTSIRVVGQVRNPEFEWKEGMSLMEALIKADWTGIQNPKEIIIIRKHERIPVDMKPFLNGEDVLLEAGDTIELHR